MDAKKLIQGTENQEAMTPYSRTMAALIAGLRHCFGNRSGNVAIEFGLVLPVVVTMLGSVIEFGFAANERTSLANGARVGAQYALQQGLDLDGIRDAVDSASGLVIASEDITAVEFYECSGDALPSRTHACDS